MSKAESKYFSTAKRMDEALLSLLLEKEFAYITGKEICTRAGMNRSTFYLHYENTADLLEETVEMVHAQFQENAAFATEKLPITGDTPLQELIFVTDRWLAPYLEFVKVNRYIYKAIHSQMEVFGGEGAYKRFFETIYSPILTRFGVAKEKHEYVMEFYRYGLVAVLMKWVDPDCRESLEYVAGIIKLCVGPDRQ